MNEIICQECGRKYVYDNKDKKGHTKTVCNSCKVNNRKHSIMQKAIEYKGGKCQVCGYDKCSRALKFHHRDPSQKSFTISGNFCRKWETIRHELDKCDLVCGNCHDEIHHEEDTAQYKKWTPRILSIILKECPFCKKEFRATNKKQVYCTVECGKSARYAHIVPSKDELVQSIKELKGNICAVSRKYKVSDNAVRKWIKRYGI